MKFNNKKLKPVLPEVRLARILHMFDTVKVIVGSDEQIFDDTFIYAIIGENRVVKFNKSVVEYL